ERTARHVGGVLEDASIPGHQGGRGEAEHLPEGEVPGHHGEHGPEWIEADVTPRGLRLARLLGEKGLGVVRVVLAGPGALVDLRLALNDRLAHLEGHGAGVFGPARSKDLRGFSHPLRPPREGDLPPLEERRVCPHENSFPTARLSVKPRRERSSIAPASVWSSVSVAMRGASPANAIKREPKRSHEDG